MKASLSLSLSFSLLYYLQDPSYYAKAWELSNHRSARAQRSLGLYHLRQEHYEECIDSLQLALNINAMQVMLCDHVTNLS